MNKILQTGNEFIIYNAFFDYKEISKKKNFEFFIYKSHIVNSAII